MFLYKTIAEYASVEETIEKSKFIGYAKPVASREEALLFVSECKAKHKEASHNVPAFVIGEKSEMQWCSDDGEPQGTSGQPILKVIMGEGLTYLAVVVTRYFGGVKLGPGGLARAYSSLAKQAIFAAGISEVSKGRKIDIEVDYKDYQKILKNAEKEEFIIKNEKFMDKVQISVLVSCEKNEKVKEIIRDLTNGSFKILAENDWLFNIRIDNKNPVC